MLAGIPFFQLRQLERALDIDMLLLHKIVDIWQTKKHITQCQIVHVAQNKNYNLTVISFFVAYGNKTFKNCGFSADNLVDQCNLF